MLPPTVPSPTPTEIRIDPVDADAASPVTSFNDPDAPPIAFPVDAANDPVPPLLPLF